MRIVENTNLVFQSSPIDTSLSSSRGIHHSQQGGGDVDKLYSTLEGRSGKASEVGNHTTAKVDHHRVACRSMLLQLIPHMSQGTDVFMCVCGLDNDEMSILQPFHVGYQWPTFLFRRLVNKNEETVVSVFCEIAVERLYNIFRTDNLLLLFHKNDSEDDEAITGSHGLWRQSYIFIVKQP